jgi:hypothetical protein
MRRFLILIIESTLLFLDRIENNRPRLRKLTVYPALAIVLLREKIDPYRPAIDNAPNRDDEYLEKIGPVTLMKNPVGGYGLLYYGQGEVSDYIVRRGGQGGGYSWESLVRAVLEISSSEAKSLTFDPEADMFAVYASDVEILRKIAQIIVELNDNREKLDQAIAMATENGTFE